MHQASAFALYRKSELKLEQVSPNQVNASTSGLNQFGACRDAAEVKTEGRKINVKVERHYLTNPFAVNRVSFVLEVTPAGDFALASRATGGLGNWPPPVSTSFEEKWDLFLATQRILTAKVLDFVFQIKQTGSSALLVTIGDVAFELKDGALIAREGTKRFLRKEKEEPKKSAL